MDKEYDTSPKNLTEQELEDTKKLRSTLQELEWREKEIIDGRLSAYDLSNRLVSLSWRYVQVVLPELRWLLRKYNSHHSADGNAEIIEKMLKN